MNNNSSKLINALKILLADTYVLLLKTQNCHWNVEGSNFYALHIMFENQYNDLFQAVDLIAERIRVMNIKAPATFAEYLALTTLSEENNSNSYKMCEDVLHSQEKIINTLNNVVAAAQDCNDEATIGISVNRIEVHQKMLWMLRSSLKFDNHCGSSQ